MRESMRLTVLPAIEHDHIAGVAVLETAPDHRALAERVGTQRELRVQATIGDASEQQQALYSLHVLRPTGSYVNERRAVLSRNTSCTAPMPTDTLSSGLAL